MMAFNFSPVNGLLDSNTFPTNPGSETEARQQFMTPLNQVKDFLNNLNIDEWSKSFGASGYQKLPSGLIIQWGTADLSSVAESASNGVTFKSLWVTFPIAFTTTFLGAYFGTYRDLRGSFYQPTNEGFRLEAVKGANTWPSSVMIRWFALGC